ncbi:MAG: MoxR family ATPase [Myxococcota bacterium]
MAPFESVSHVVEVLAQGHYVCNRPLATALFLATKLQRPLFLEGEPGVGKTELAKVVAQHLGRQLIRLQCYEGLDVSAALYEWNVPRQLVQVRLAEAAEQVDVGELESSIYSERFLLERPLLRALRPHEGGAPVLLIDELDRTDEPFEAFLLELLSDFQVTIPELGTVVAPERPIVILTSNRTREVHDALKRRCLYHWVDYPGEDQELAILGLRVPGCDKRLARQVVSFVQSVRRRELYKNPGIAETLDWAQALMALDVDQVTGEAVAETAGVLFKYQDDVDAVVGEVAEELATKARQA